MRVLGEAYKALAEEAHNHQEWKEKMVFMASDTAPNGEWFLKETYVI
jgi:hypothetical protein